MMMDAPKFRRKRKRIKRSADDAVMQGWPANATSTLVEHPGEAATASLEAHDGAASARREDSDTRSRLEDAARARDDSEARARRAEAAHARASANARALIEARAKARRAEAARARAKAQARIEARMRARREAADLAFKEIKAKRKADEARAEAAAGAGAHAPARPAPLTLREEDRAGPTPALLTLGTENRAPSARSPWERMDELIVDLDHLNRHRIVTADRLDPAHTHFDVLRTRILHALQARGWKRVAITSPGAGCGKTFVAANLAISLSRQEAIRTLLLDMDMRRPALHRVMGRRSPVALGDVLRGAALPETHFLRMGPNRIHAGRNIAFGLNTVLEPYASELLQDPRCARALDMVEDRLAPDVMLFDLPPALFYDDVIAMSPLFDAVLLVIGAGLTTEREIKEVERRLGKETPLLGMVLNKAEGVDTAQYTY